MTEIDRDRWSHRPADIGEEIQVYEAELRPSQAGQMSEKVFLEFRLSHSVYGQGLRRLIVGAMAISRQLSEDGRYVVRLVGFSPALQSRNSAR